MNEQEEAECVWQERIFFLRRSRVTSTVIKSLNAKKVAFRVATLCESPRALKHLSTHTRRLSLNSTRKPVERTKWIYHFPTIYQFFADAVEANDNLYVISKSGAFAKMAVLAFLIGYEHNTLAQSVTSLKALRQEVFPEALWHQLQLWAAMGGQLDENSSHWQRYQESIKRTTESISRSSSFIDAPKRFNEAVKDYRGSSNRFRLVHSLF